MMRNLYTTTQFIAKEGWSQIALAVLLFFVAYTLSFFTWIFGIVLVWTLYCYRNPERIAEEDDERCLIAPMDGKIADISKVTLFDGKEVLRIVIEKSLLDVGILRAPLAFDGVEMKKRFGLFVKSSSPLFSLLSERTKLTCKNKFAEITLVISAGQWSQNIAFFSKRGSFKANERIGFLRDGEVALLLPLDTRIKVSMGDDVKAGVNILGYLSYKDKDDK